MVKPQWLLTANLMLCTLLASYPASAQIAPDSSLGTKVKKSANQLEITGGKTRGGNLFHSFKEFSVPKGNAAYFKNNAAIENIITRITGSKLSEILGNIKANGGANLIIINPNGIFFGKNARLQIGGSFLGSTANSVVFQDGTIFTTSTQEKPLLTVSVPLGVQFNNPGASITVKGADLEVNQGKNIALVGGEVIAENATISASNGKVELGGLAAAGEVGINPDFNLSFPEDVAFSNIVITDQSSINVIALERGSISIHAHNVEISQTSSVLAGINSTTSPANENVGEINIKATGIVKLTEGSAIANIVNALVKKGGDIKISGDAVNVDKGAGIVSTSFSSSSSGNIEINANNSVSFDGQDSQDRITGILTSVSSNSSANAGNIIIKTGSLSVTNGAQFLTATNGSGNAGNVEIEASSQVSLDGFNDNQEVATISSISLNDAKGDGGNLIIKTGSLSVTNGAVLFANTMGEGNAGNIEITASNTVSFDGVGPNETSSQASSSVEDNANGNGGNVVIKTGSLSVTNGAALLASTSGQGNAGNVEITASDKVSFDGVGTNQTSSQASTAVFKNAQGEGGKVVVKTGSLSVTNGAGLLAQTMGEGNAGNVEITASDKVSFDGVGTNQTSSQASTAVFKNAKGDGGKVVINSGSLSVTNGANLLAQTRGEGNAGNVEITASDKVSFDGVGTNQTSSQASTAVFKNAKGDGGKVVINSSSLSVTNGGILVAGTRGQGNAGNVEITASDTVSFDGGLKGKLTTFASSAVGTNANGDGGELLISAASLFVTNGAQLLAGTDGQGDGGNMEIITKETSSFDEGSQALIGVDRNGTGNAGTLTIKTGSLLVTNGSRVGASTRAEGNAGNITIEATQDVFLQNDGIISARSSGEGFGGNVYLSAQSLTIDNQSAITAQTDGSQGGSITLDVADSVKLLDNSRITAQVNNLESSADEGNIVINTQFLFANNNSNIKANTPTEGGNVEINTSDTFLCSDCDVFATSTVEINTSLDGENTFAVLKIPQQPTQDQLLAVTSSCNPNSSQSGSGNFSLQGRGTLPIRPTEPQESLSVVKFDDTPNSDKDNLSVIKSELPTPARGWYVNSQGKTILTSRLAISTPYGVELMSPNCDQTTP